MAKNTMGFRANQAKVYGLATVKVGKSSAKITFEESGDEYKFSLDDLPSKPKLHPESEDTYMVVLTAEKDAVEKIGPAEGRVQAHCIDFARTEEGADPAPVEGTSNYQGKETKYLRFTALWEVLTGKYKGLVIPHFLRYKLEEGPDGMTQWQGNPNNPNATHLPKLIDFCEKTGVFDEEPNLGEWPDDGNVLPLMLERIQAADKHVDLVIKKGYISDLLALDYEDADEDEEEVKPKSKAKSFKPEDAPKQKSYKTAVKKAKKSSDEDDEDEM